MSAQPKPQQSGFGGQPQQPSGFGMVSGPTNAFGQAQAQPSSGFGGTVNSGIDWRKQLVEFYSKHNPSKLSTVDTTLAKYKGQEAQLFLKLQKKYGGGNTMTNSMGNSGFGAPQSSAGSNPFATVGGGASSGGGFMGGFSGSSFGRGF